LVLQDRWGLGVGLTTLPCETIIGTKPSKKEGRPKPTPGCSDEEEEEVVVVIIIITPRN
jgi:hypothetical protein